MLAKLKYGLSRLRDELTDTEDYWHIRFMARTGLDYKKIEKYYLDISGKSYYPFELKGKIPLVSINQVKVELPVTILNYGLGFFDRYPEGKEEILEVYNWLKDNQTESGAWLQHFDDATYRLKSGWISGMTQGLAISFLLRCISHRLVDRTEAEQMVEKALQCMLSDSCVKPTSCGDFIEEYGGTDSHVLNGYVFSVYGLYDYGIYRNDMSHFEKFEQTLSCMVPGYDFHGWTYYDKKKLIASRLYHNLHVEMMRSMFLLTGKEVYKKYYNRWKRYERLFFVFVLMKSVQKFSGLSKMDTLDK